MKLLHTMIRVKDLEESLQFYVGFIGLKEVRRKEIGDEAVLVFLADEDERHHVELTWNRGKTDYVLGDQFGHLAFGAPDLEAVVVLTGGSYENTPYLSPGEIAATYILPAILD